MPPEDDKPLTPAERELAEPSLTVYEAKPIVTDFDNTDTTPVEMLPPDTHEKSPLGRALADVELRDLTITHLNRDIVALQHDVAKLRDKMVEMVVVENAQAVEIDALKEKLATALDERSVLAARLKSALLGR